MVKYVTKNQIKALYRKRLKPRLRNIEKERIKIKTKVLLVIVVTICLILAACFFVILSKTSIRFTDLFSSTDPGTISLSGILKSSGDINFNLFIFIFIGGSALSGFLIKFLTRDFRRKFKQDVIKEMFDLLIQDCVFSQESHISSGHFEDSKLVTRSYNRFKGEDHVTGRIGNIDIEFSEIEARHISGSGKNRRDVEIFDGLFFKCTFDKRIKAPILIHSDVAERFFGKAIGRFFQKKSKRGFDLVQLESPEFEKHFAVYSTDQVQARVILNPKTMDRLTQFLKKYHERIEISIINQNLYFLIHTQKDHFEPKIFSDALKWKDVMEIYDLLSLMVELINQFNLDKRVKSNAS